jgi:hypothetical protein
VFVACFAETDIGGRKVTGVTLAAWDRREGV